MFADLTVAVEVGMVLAALLFIRRVATTTTVSRVTKEYLSEGRPHVLQDKQIPDYVAIYRIHGPFLFGATDKITRVIDDLPNLPAVVIFRLRNMTALDATGLRALEDIADRTRASGRTAVFCGAREQPRGLMRQSGFAEHVGAENVTPHVEAALRRAEQIKAEGTRQKAEGSSLTSDFCLVPSASLILRRRLDDVRRPGTRVRPAAAFEAADRADGHVVVAEDLAGQPHAVQRSSSQRRDLGLRLPLRFAVDELDAAGRAPRVAATGMELVDPGVFLSARTRRLFRGTSNEPTDSTVRVGMHEQCSPGSRVRSASDPGLKTGLHRRNYRPYLCLILGIRYSRNADVKSCFGAKPQSRRGGAVVDVLGPGVHDALSLFVDVIRDVRRRKRAEDFGADFVGRGRERAEAVGGLRDRRPRRARRARAAPPRHPASP